MRSPLEYDGIWWRPAEPGKKVPGQMKFTPGEHVVLETQGNLTDHPDGIPSAFTTPIIIGLTISGKLVTLYECVMTNLVVNFAGIPVHTLRATYAFVGVHFETEESIRFTVFSINYSNLEDWIGHESFHVDRDPDKIVITYERPPRIRMAANDLNIHIGSSWNLKDDGFTGCSITNTAVILMQHESGLTIKEWLPRMRDLTDFLTLVIGHPTYPQIIEGETDENKEILDNGQPRYPPVTILFWMPDWPGEIKKVSCFEMLLPLLAMREQLPQLLAAWFNKASVLQPVYSLYFATLYASNLYLDTVFLNLAQAAETYHRRVLGGKFQTDDDFQKTVYPALRDAIPANLPKNYKDSLSVKLQYLHEYPLRRRLHQIIEAVEAVPMRFIASVDARKEFVNNVCDTRNYLTHYDEKLADRAVKGIKLAHLVIKLRALLEVCLLHEAGFSFETIRAATKKHRRHESLY